FAGFLDRWLEILDVMRRRKLRTALTALSVAWGIFMLVVLLAAGEGLANGAETQFSRDAMNSVFAFPTRLSKPHEGNPVGKSVRLYNEDLELARDKLPIIELSSAVRSMNGLVRRGLRNASFEVQGVQPDYGAIEKSDIVAGRFLNPDDQSERRKVAVIGVKVKQMLFAPDESAVGEMIEISRMPFTVIGVFDEAEEEESQLRVIFIPLSTQQVLFPWRPQSGPSAAAAAVTTSTPLTTSSNRIERMVFTVGDASGTETEQAIKDLRTMLAARKGFDPEDKEAVRIFNLQEVYERFRRLFAGIRTFVWLIGLGTILAGVVGVSNIMLISVQERTREIGVRKAVGAPPASIIAMIVQEALAITLVSGYLGLCAGVALVNLAQKAVPPGPFFRRPDIDLGTALMATGVLVVAGMLAGFFPALRAARINPIAALRVE
ncbi:MAG TPA: ABC transporter permease, partial [Polyangia bacterium]